MLGNPYFFCNESDMDNSKTVDHPDRKTVAVRQGTGPRATVSVLLIRCSWRRLSGWSSSSTSTGSGERAHMGTIANKLAYLLLRASDLEAQIALQDK